jgi:putative ATP-binding cassette transporter
MFLWDRFSLFTLACLSILVLFQSISYTLFSYVQRDIYNGLSNLDRSKLNSSLEKYLAIIIVLVPVSIMKNLLSRLLPLHQRTYLTGKCLQEYLNGQNYGQLEASKLIDNPDQRICEDIDSFTRETVDFFLIIIEALFNFFLFTYVLLRISPILYVTVFLYASAINFLLYQLSIPFIQLTLQKIRCEANFRFGFVLFRRNISSVSLWNPMPYGDRENIWALFIHIHNVTKQIIYYQLGLDSIQKFYEYFAFLIPLLLLSRHVLNRTLDLGTLMQASDAFFNIRSSLSVMINFYNAYAKLCSGYRRIASLQSALVNRLSNTNNHIIADVDDNEKRRDRPAILFCFSSPSSSLPVYHTHQEEESSLLQRSLPVTQIDPPYIVTCEELSVDLSTGRRLIDGLSFSLLPQLPTLIMGETGSGKSTLLRCLAGVWTEGEGRIMWNSEYKSHTECIRCCLFVPQNPYILSGKSLKEVRCILVACRSWELIIFFINSKLSILYVPCRRRRRPFKDATHSKMNMM